MKIEIAESLMSSWLRHVRHCQIVQTNWTTIPSLARDNKLESQQTIMDELSALFATKGYDLFKKTKNVEQLLKQSECDIIGVQLTQNGKAHIIAAEVAFHERGLQYNVDNNKELAALIIKKCARSALCMERIFSQKEGEIIFASPKISAQKYQLIQTEIPILQDFFESKGYRFTFCVLGNREFTDEILLKTIEAQRDASNTEELFLRAYRLYRLCIKQ